MNAAKKPQQSRLEYLFNYFIVFIMKAHDEREKKIATFHKITL